MSDELFNCQSQFSDIYNKVSELIPVGWDAENELSCYAIMYQNSDGQTDCEMLIPNDEELVKKSIDIFIREMPQIHNRENTYAVLWTR